LPSYPDWGDDVPYNSSGLAEDLRTESLLALVLEFYRAAHETPADEFPGLALAMLRALASIDPDEVMRAAQILASGIPAADASASRSDASALADHVANAIRLNRALQPQPHAALGP
jgi:hypothetical protein